MDAFVVPYARCSRFFGAFLALWHAFKYICRYRNVTRYHGDDAIDCVQACRCMKAGNCAMSSYNAGEGDN